MKKSFISLGLIVAATFALTNCAKELENLSQQPESAGIPFEITASTPDTKTANDDLATNWVANDALSVFHVETGATEFVENDQFTITSENLAANKFTGELAVAPEAGKSYDWYVFYPYDDQYGASKLAEGKIGYTNYGSTCQNGEVSTGQSQDGNNSKSHLAGDKSPLYGVVKNVASQSSVSVELSHLMSVIEVEVKNSTTEPITVTNIKFTAPGYIVGSFYYDTVNGDYETSSNDGKYNSKTAELNVKNAEAIAVGASANFYIGIIPITVNSGEISMTVATDKGTQTKTKSNANISFAAGVIKNIGFTYNQAVEVKTVSLPWTEDFSSEDLTNYTIVSGGSTTELYDASLAGGTAPEIMISKGDGSLQANVLLGGNYGDFTLSYKRNNNGTLVVSVGGTGVVLEEPVTSGDQVKHKITIPEGLDMISVKFTNTHATKNLRLDDISLTKGWLKSQTLSFASSSVELVAGSSEAEAFKGQVVSGAETTVTYMSSNTSVATVNATTGAVTLVGTGETTITATAVATAEYEGAAVSYKLIINDVQLNKYSLLSSDIKAVGEAWGYADRNKTITASDGATWYCDKTYRTASQTTVQIKASSDIGYLMTPSTSTAIKKVEVTVRGSKAGAILLIKDASASKELARQTLTNTQTKYSVTLSGTDTQLKFMSGNATIYIQEVIIHY